MLGKERFCTLQSIAIFDIHPDKFRKKVTHRSGKTYFEYITGIALE
jgi:hypothetical protein